MLAFTCWVFFPQSPCPGVYANIHNISGSRYKVFIRGKTLKINLDVIFVIIHICWVIHPLFPYLFAETLPSNSFVRSSLFNSPLGEGSTGIHTESLFTDRRILLRIICINLWPVSITLHYLWIRLDFYMHFCMTTLDIPSFFCHKIVHIFRKTSIKIGLPYACLIYHLVTSLRASFSDGTTWRVSWPIGKTTFHRVGPCSFKLCFF